MPRYAAIDIGSNSIRMMAAEVSHGETSVLAEDRQVVRLGEKRLSHGPGECGSAECDARHAGTDGGRL